MSINKTLNSIFSPQFGTSDDRSMSPSQIKNFAKTTRVKSITKHAIPSQRPQSQQQMKSINQLKSYDSSKQSYYEIFRCNITSVISTLSIFNVKINSLHNYFLLASIARQRYCSFPKVGKVVQMEYTLDHEDSSGVGAGLSADAHGGSAALKRSKERRIDFVIERVKQWRRLFNGVPDQKDPSNLVRYSLEEAAQRVGLSKKSLDDYLLQIRFAKRFGFDFEKHRCDPIGVLRQFVKKQKQNGKKGGLQTRQEDHVSLTTAPQSEQITSSGDANLDMLEHGL